MADITRTLQELRRGICSELRMPFFRRYVNGYSTIKTGSSASLIKDTALTQADKFWNKMWFYHVPTQSISLIRAFQAQTDSFNLELPLESDPTVLDQYEIHSIWNAQDIKIAINRAIGAANRTFPDSVSDKNTFVIKENNLTYSLSDLTKKPWLVNRIWIESVPSVKRGTLVSASGSSATVENSDILSDVEAGWLISIYSGTGIGQVRTISGISGSQVNISVNWATTPTSTSKYAIWNPEYQLQDWYETPDFHTDSKEFPDTLYLHGRYPASYGLRIRIEYLALDSDLSTETDTTIIPKEYITAKAISILYGQHMNNVKADKDTAYALFKRYSDEADAYIARNAPHMPDSIWRRPSEGEGLYLQENPLNWQPNGGD